MYRFLIDGLLFSSGITNEASILFISCKGSTNASKAITNGKPCKSLGVIHLDKIEKWKQLT